MNEAPWVPLEAGLACERVYQALVDGSPQPLRVRWFQPDLLDGYWNCTVQMIWPDGQTRMRRVGGEDSTQALVLALSAVGAELLAFKSPVYLFAIDDDLGLPVMDAVADLAVERKTRFEAK